MALENDYSCTRLNQGNIHFAFVNSILEVHTMTKHWSGDESLETEPIGTPKSVMRNNQCKALHVIALLKPWFSNLGHES